MTEPTLPRLLALAEADDPSLAEELLRFSDPELVGELMVAVYRSDTPAAHAALAPLLARPFRRGYWQGFKRIHKLAEERLARGTWSAGARVLDEAGYTWPPSGRTLQYMQRRAYRHLKRIARERPDELLDYAEALLAGRARLGPITRRLLRVDHPGFQGGQAGAGAFQARLDNPYALEEGGDEPDPLALLDLDAAALLAHSPEVPTAPQTQGSQSQGAQAQGAQTQGAPSLGAQASGAQAGGAAPAAWPGPIFAELWALEPGRVLGLLTQVPEALGARALVRLLDEQVGERLLAEPLDAFYALLEHPVEGVWRFGLAQLAARARSELLRFDELVPLFARAAERRPPAWDVIADLLYVLDDPRAEAARAGLAEPLLGLARRHLEAPEIGPVVEFVRRHFAERLGPPLFDAAAALDLLGARRPDVRGLGRDALLRVTRAAALSGVQVARLLQTPFVEEEPEAVFELLSASPGCPGGYRPPARISERLTASLTRDLPQAGFLVWRRALLHFEEQGGLDPKVAQLLIADDERRARGLGLELLGAALRRGALGLLGLVELLRVRHEDVVLWARERIEEAAGEGRLPNEALYRMLDATAADLRGFGRELVREHLLRFEVAELIVFCAESPDATTAELGIALYQRELAGREDYDLAQLLPMFRILLYQVARARGEKERLYALLRAWSLEAPAQAELTVEVIAAFRRSTCRIDLTRALTLLVAIQQRFGEEVSLPFATRAVFGATLSGGEAS